MKKALSLILALVLCLSLCACGVSKEKGVSKENGVSKEKVEEELQGIWERIWYSSADGFTHSVFLEFDDGSLDYTVIRNGDVASRHGYYVITNKVVEIWFAGEGEPFAELTYKYEDGELSLVNYGDGTPRGNYTKAD